MKRLRYLLASTAVAIALAGSANAQMTTTGRWGDWTTTAGLNNGGRPQCAAYLQGRDGRSFSVKFSLEYGLFIHINKASWDIPGGKKMDVELQIDSVSRTYHAYGNRSGHGIEIDLNPDDRDPVTGEPVITLFTNLLANGLDLYVHFPDGNENSWEGSLEGSAAAMTSLKRCAMMVAEYSKPATQPFGGGTTNRSTSRPTQPYSEM